jgi:uncharacterized protein (TIRG00374 family)
MSERSRRWLFQSVSILIAGLLLYLALRGVDIERVGNDLANGSYGWVFPLIAITVVSHLLRAWRWTLLLNVLPSNQNKQPERVPIVLAFKSLMIGYMANYAAPRLGEVVRTSHMAARRHLPFGSVLGTVIAERVLDVFSLALALLTLPILLGPDLQRVWLEVFNDVDSSRFGTTILWGFLILSVLVVGAVLFIRKKRAREGSSSKVAALILSFKDGVASILRTGKFVQLSLSTVLIWACYTLMGFWPFYIFGMTETYGLTIVQGWSLMLLGSIGVLIPSPGGIGSYHYIAITALVGLWGVEQSTASSYAIFTHGGQLILYVIIGFAVLISDGSSWSELMTTTSKADESEL